MPTFTAITLDSLLEHRSQRTAQKPPPLLLTSERLPLAAWVPENKNILQPYASPLLYTTPEATPLPDSPSLYSPSPYIINHKRRGPRLVKSFSEKSNVGGCEPPFDARPNDDMVSGGRGEEALNGLHHGHHKGEQKIGDEHGSQVEGSLNNSHNGNLGKENLNDGLLGREQTPKPVAVDPEGNEESDNFFDLQDISNVSSITEVDNDNGFERSWNPSTPHGEYFDTFEEIGSESASQSSYRNIEEELREIRFNLLMEVERRKQAEDSLESLQNQWHRLTQQLTQVGLKLPAAPTIIEEKDEQSNTSPGQELCQQVVLARMVAHTLGRACSRAEYELEVEPVIESKNFEIARLCDRLHYYESANREMSQRNQEVVEMARQKRHRRKRGQIWLWSSVGIAITLGAAAITWSYLPPSEPSSHDGDAATSEQ